MIFLYYCLNIAFYPMAQNLFYKVKISHVKVIEPVLALNVPRHTEETHEIQTGRFPFYISMFFDFVITTFFLIEYIRHTKQGR